MSCAAQSTHGAGHAMFFSYYFCTHPSPSARSLRPASRHCTGAGHLRRGLAPAYQRAHADAHSMCAEKKKKKRGREKVNGISAREKALQQKPRGARCHACVFIAAGGAIRDRLPPPRSSIPSADVSPVLIDIVFGPFSWNAREALAGRRTSRRETSTVVFPPLSAHLKTHTRATLSCTAPVVSVCSVRAVSAEQTTNAATAAFCANAASTRSGRSTFLHARGN